MTSDRGLTDTEIVGLDRRDMLRLYERVLGEMILRHQKQHPETFSPADERHGAPDPADTDTSLPGFQTLDAEELLRHYRSVSAEMVRRHRDRPGIWGPAADISIDE